MLELYEGSAERQRFWVPVQTDLGDHDAVDERPQQGPPQDLSNFMLGRFKMVIDQGATKKQKNM
jgi:hypothetical protein